MTFPRVSAGSLATMFMQKMLVLTGNQGRISHSMMRAHNVVDALVQGKTDLGIVHRSTIDPPTSLAVRTLLPWRAVLISPRYRFDPLAEFSTFVWEEGTLGDVLLQRFRSNQPDFPMGATARARSFLDALEMIRRELPYQLVLPDLYLTNHDRRTLPLQYPKVPVTDELVAVYRTDDAERLEIYLNEDDWLRLAKRDHSLASLG